MGLPPKGRIKCGMTDSSSSCLLIIKPPLNKESRKLVVSEAFHKQGKARIPDLSFWFMDARHFDSVNFLCDLSAADCFL
jgi:hypothetical protein